MQNKRVALVTGANQGVGFQVARELVANGVTVLVGSRNFGRGEAAAKEIGTDAIPLQLDVTDRASITAAAKRSGKTHPSRGDRLSPKSAIMPVVAVALRSALDRITDIDNLCYRGLE